VLVVPRKSGRLTDVAGSLIEYVNCWVVDLTAFECVRPWCLLNKVDQLQCHLAATF
jgi:hypothetical protein